MGANRRVLDHGHIVEPAHVGHAAVRVAAMEVTAQQVELLGRGLGLDEIARQISVPSQNLAMGS